jgi:hypothetical protein
MYLKILTMNGWPPPQYSCPYMWLEILYEVGQKQLKHVADDNWMYNVLNVAFTLTINADVDLQTHKDDNTKIY